MCNDLMKISKYLIPAANLQNTIPFSAVILSDTRCSSVFFMLKRYLEITHFIKIISQPDGDIKNLLLDHTQDSAFKYLYNDLKQLNSVMVALQVRKYTMATVWNIFDEAINDIPIMSFRLSEEAHIVHNKSLEKAFVKLQAGRTDVLTNEERRSMEIFKKGIFYCHFQHRIPLCVGLVNDEKCSFLIPLQDLMM